MCRHCKFHAQSYHHLYSIWNEEFDDCQNFSQAYSCNQSLNIDSLQRLCFGDDLSLNISGNYSNNAIFSWTGPNGYTSSNETPIINNTL
jgi:hypothetical protein